MKKQEWILMACARLDFTQGMIRQEIVAKGLQVRLVDARPEVLQAVEGFAGLLEQKGYFNNASK